MTREFLGTAATLKGYTFERRFSIEALGNFSKMTDFFNV